MAKMFGSFTSTNPLINLYRHVLEPLSGAGYHLVVPDMRGHGASSHPPHGYTKSILAEDMYHPPRDRLGRGGPIYVIGHDIGGMALIRGECPIPGTTVFEDTKASQKQFHFTFQAHFDLDVHVVTGKEKAYLKHFYDKLSCNAAGIPPGVLDHYALMYSQSGALRCAFSTYEAFEQDAVENGKRLKDHGKCGLPTLGLDGQHSSHATDMEAMLPEMYENFSCEVVPNSGHWIAENPVEFVRPVLGFFQKHPIPY
ncbi:related to haloacetate dehalogenase H-1 [Phialocephala subalpina]|uniref:Related to haloacetate dehalogenase H-1 n=1 Tax=Phialocephala subalpina TaxID=576137 RepID=A0A1L7X7V6_9HELO|nr:related to haloacetate dehalogenase H-1 [Phialocephala subalpina]